MNNPTENDLKLAKIYQDCAQAHWQQSRNILANGGTIEKALKYELFARVDYTVARKLMGVEVL